MNKPRLLFLLLFVLNFSISFAQTCGNAIPNDIYTSPVTRYTIAGDDASFNLGSCSLDGDNAVWISVVIPSNAVATEMTITLDDWGGCGTFCATDITGAFYSGSCGSLTAINTCIDMSSGFTNGTNEGPWTFSITPGTTYYFRLSEEDSDDGYADLLFTLNSYALPVELVDFKGKGDEKSNLLEWETSTEYNTEYFIVERSLDANTWKEIDMVNAVGFTEENQKYEMQDFNPLSSAYYRLKIVDFDGAVEFSETILLENELIERGETLVKKVFPNPSNGDFTLQFSEIETSQSMSLLVVNALGKVVKSEKITSNILNGNNWNVNISGLPNGMYFLTVQDERGNTFTEKLYKKTMLP